jgi:hypothetical protein
VSLSKEREGDLGPRIVVVLIDARSGEVLELRGG